MTGGASLLERDAEFAVLERALLDLRAGRGALLLVEGEPGIGKSALLRHVSVRAQQLDLRLLSAAGMELDQDHAYGTLRQLLLPSVRNDQSLVTGAAGAARSALGLGTEGELKPHDHAIAHALYWFVVALCAPEPVVLVVDDLHWVDVASRRALAALAARIEGLPVLILLGSRPHPDLALELDQALRLPSSQELRPRHLTADAVRRLVAELWPDSEVSAGFATACAELTGGVPFLVRELLHAVRAEQVSPDDAGINAMRGLAPRGVRRSILVRLRRLAPNAQALAHAVAVVPRPVEPVVAARIAGLDAAALPVVTAALVEAHVLVDGPLLDTVHPLVRTALYEDLPHQQRAVLHDRAAKALRSAGAAHEDVAAQLLRTLCVGDPDKARELHRVGVAALLSGAVDAALVFLDRSLAEPPAAENRADVLSDLGWAAHAARRPDAEALLLEAHAAAVEPGARATIAGRLAEVYVVLGPTATPRWDLVLASLDELAARDEQRLRLAARVYCLTDRDATTDERMRAIAATIPPDLRGATPGERACLCVLAAETAIGGGHVDDARALLDRAGFDGGLRDAHDLDWVQDSVHAVAYLRCTGLVSRSARMSAEVVARLRLGGRPVEMAWALAQQSSSLVRLGSVSEAAAASDTALAVLEGRKQDTAFIQATLMSLRALIERAELARARDVLASLVRSEDMLSQITRLVVEAELLAASGQAADAVELQLRAGALWLPLSRRNPALDEWGHDAAMLLAAVGRRDEARAILEECLVRARQYGLAPAEGWLLRAAGVVERDPDLSREAVRLLTGSDYRLEHARALVDLGTVLRRRGHDREARDRLGEGLALALEYGALLLADRARDELRAAGGRSVDRVRRGPAALTAAETRITRLAAEGSSNRDIAERLFVTIRTVEMHLGNAYRKLGISSRRELTAALEPAADA